MRLFAVVVLIASAAAGLSGCDWLGIDSPEKVVAARVAEGNAVGSACRHAGHAIEDCFALNKKTDKAAIFAGWREMNDYMREHQIGAVAPQLDARVTSGAIGSLTNRSDGNAADHIATDADRRVVAARSQADAPTNPSAVAPSK